MVDSCTIVLVVASPLAKLWFYVHRLRYTGEVSILMGLLYEIQTKIHGSHNSLTHNPVGKAKKYRQNKLKIRNFTVTFFNRRK
jgi:hypothetical protein